MDSLDPVPDLCFVAERDLDDVEKLVPPGEDAVLKPEIIHLNNRLLAMKIHINAISMHCLLFSVMRLGAGF